MRRHAIIATILICSCYNSTVFDLYETLYPSGPWPTQRDGPWEHFETGTIDLEGYSLIFRPQRGATVSYSWDTEGGLTEFPISPGSGASTTRLTLTDDSFQAFSFQRLDTLRFYGEPYEQIFVGSNGYVTFGAGSQSLSVEAREHFNLPTVSALRHDLDPRNSGRVVVDEWATLVAITYEGVPAYGESEPNDVQIVLHTNGTIELHYIRLSNRTSWLVGLSNGLRGPQPDEVNFVGGSTTREQCWDGIDNDGDGFVDCEDFDCAGECGDDREYDCFNGWDDDEDGLVDCDDPDCAYEMECYAERECRDGLDNDGDGLADCDDPDCWGEPGCEISCLGYWESFEAGEPEDLNHTRLRFRLAPSNPQGYDWTVGDHQSDFAIEPFSGDASEELELGDDDSVEYFFQLLEDFTFFGRAYDSVFVSSNGYVTFGRGSSSLGTEPWSHFELPSIAALRGDLNPRSGGTVVVDESSNYVAFTFLDVPWFGDSMSNSFQIALRRSGNITVSYVDIPEGRGRYIAGLSNGCGSENYPAEVDFVSDFSENCTDGIDNDGDGFADCDDADCLSEPLCAVEHNCSDGRDNDSDGLTDCNDSDCVDTADCRDISRGYWEQFDETNPVDLEGYLVTYTPTDYDPNGYALSVVWRGFGFIDEPGRGDFTTELEIRGDDFVEYPLTICEDLPFYGVYYDRIFVSSNGYVTFGEGSTSQSVEPDLHFYLPSVAGYRADLDPLSAGVVVVDEFRDHVMVTYDSVPFWDAPTTSNSVQVSLSTDGSVRVHYALLEGEADAIVGISDGAGFSAPPETDFIP